MSDIVKISHLPLTWTIVYISGFWSVDVLIYLSDGY